MSINRFAFRGTIGSNHSNIGNNVMQTKDDTKLDVGNSTTTKCRSNKDQNIVIITILISSLYAINSLINPETRIHDSNQHVIHFFSAVYNMNIFNASLAVNLGPPSIATFSKSFKHRIEHEWKLESKPGNASPKLLLVRAGCSTNNNVFRSPIIGFCLCAINFVNNF